MRHRSARADIVSNTVVNVCQREALQPRDATNPEDWALRRCEVSSGLLGCFVKSNASIFQPQHKKGNLLIDNEPETVPDSHRLSSQKKNNNYKTRQKKKTRQHKEGVKKKGRDGCGTTAQLLTSQAEYRSIWLRRHCRVTFAFKCYLVIFK